MHARAATLTRPARPPRLTARARPSPRKGARLGGRQPAPGVAQAVRRRERAHLLLGQGRQRADDLHPPRAQRRRAGARGGPAPALAAAAPDGAPLCRRGGSASRSNSITLSSRPPRSRRPLASKPSAALAPMPTRGTWRCCRRRSTSGEGGRAGQRRAPGGDWPLQRVCTAGLWAAAAALCSTCPCLEGPLRPPTLLASAPSAGGMTLPFTARAPATRCPNPARPLSPRASPATCSTRCAPLAGGVWDRWRGGWR